MKAKKPFAIVVLLALALACALALAGCGGGGGAEATEIKETIESELDELKNGKGDGYDLAKDTLTGYAGGTLDWMGLSADDLMKSYLKGFDYEVGDVSVTGTSATAKVTLKCRSVVSIVASYFAKTFLGTDDAKQALLDIVNGTDVTSSSTTVYIEKGDDGTWNTTDALKDALLKLCF